MSEPARRPVRRVLRRSVAWSLGSITLVSAIVSTEVAVGQTKNCRVDIASDCSGVDLSGADLRKTHMFRANFAGAKLQGANLEGQNLWKTNLSGADLSGAKMGHTFLTAADLRGANCQGADLRGAFLFRALTEGANFHRAQLAGARWMTGAVCGPDSIGECKPAAASASYEVRLPRWDALAEPPARPTGSITSENRSTGTVMALLPADPAVAKATDGVSFQGIPFITRDKNSVLKVRVTTGVYAEKENVAVIAVFRNEQSPPVRLVSKRVPAGQRVEFDFSFEVPAQGARTVFLDFRLGPGQPGAITLNAAEGSDMSRIRSATIIRITE